MGIPLRVLIIEDSEDDAILMLRELRKGGYDPVWKRVDTAETLARSIEKEQWDIILSDYSMPSFDGLTALEIVRNKDQDIPFIIISGLLVEESAIEILKAGAGDFIKKGHWARFMPAIDRELREAKVRLETKQAKKASEESEARYQSLFENMSEGIYQCTPEGRFININPALAYILGYDSPNELIEKVNEIGNQLFADPAESEKLLRRLVKHGKVCGFETILLRKDGSRIWVSMHTHAVLDEKGKLAILEGGVEDITNRKETEEELRQLRNYLQNVINSMPSMLVGVDPDGKVTQWNSEAAKVTGVTADKARGLMLDDVFPQLSNVKEKVGDAIRDREPKKDSKVAIYVNDKIQFSDVTVFPLLSSGVEGAVIRVDDVTERVRIEEMMIQSEKMLSVGCLAAGTAHEINNPLAGMVQTASIIASRLGENINIPANLKAAEAAGTSMEAIKNFMEARDILRMITTINESGQRVAEIVDNMLSFARKSDDSASYYAPVELLNKTLELAAADYDIKRHYDFKMIEIKKEYEENLPSVLCEGAKIQQVLLNILHNGAQAMQEAGNSNPKFIVRIRFEKSSKMVVIEIEDNGPGMDEEIRKRIFEPFFTTKPAGVGTGLGLSVSYFIITENHGGELIVESQPGAGAKFIINLPLERRET